MALQYMTQEGLDKLKKELAEAIAQRPVISAAIAACGGSTKAVKSITRVNGTAGAAWSAASRADAMNNL